MGVSKVSDQDFDAEVLKSNQPVVWISGPSGAARAA